MQRIPKTLKYFLFALGGLAGIVLLAGLALMCFVDLDAYKPRVEAMASSAMGKTVTVEGRLGIGVMPGLHITLENVRIRNRGTELAFVKEVDLAVELLPLFRQEIRYGNIATRGVRLSIERDRDGHYNYERPEGVKPVFHVLDLPKVSFANLIVAYQDQLSGSGFESAACNGELIDMRHPGDAPFLKRLSLSGQFACGDLHGQKTIVSDFKFSIAATDGVFDFKPVTMRVFGGNGTGTMRMDRSAEVPTLHLSYTLSKFRIEEYLKAQSSNKSLTGLMDFSTTLSARGRTRLETRQSASGDMSLSGTSLTLGGVDLDKELSRFVSSQHFNLFDLGALLFAGPVGLVVTKGVELSTLARQTGGSTPIRTVVSRWKVEKGVAHAADVALATGENRLALHGSLDFVNDEFQDVVVALIDANGCARLRQKIGGPFSKPAVDKTGILVPVGPFLNLLDKAKTLITGKDTQCERFYNGSVKAPK